MIGKLFEKIQLNRVQNVLSEREQVRVKQFEFEQAWHVLAVNPPF